LPGRNSSDLSELAAACKGIAEPEAELAIRRWVAELLGEVTYGSRRVHAALGLGLGIHVSQVPWSC
jgi:hypothetical protein